LDHKCFTKAFKLSYWKSNAYVLPTLFPSETKLLKKIFLSGQELGLIVD